MILSIHTASSSPAKCVQTLDLSALPNSRDTPRRQFDVRRY